MAKKCKICLQPFTPQFSSFQKTCNNTECLVDFGRQESSKLHKKAARLEKKKARDNDKQHWLKRVQVEFNKFIRNRDFANACISCQRHHSGQYHAGHYMSVGGHSAALRYSEDNCHKQCSVCNNYKSGNLAEYRSNLIKKIGLERVEWIEGPHEPKKYTVEELKSMLAHYQNLNKQWVQSQS